MALKNASRSAGAILLIVSFSTFLATFNETFLNVALTPIMADLEVNAATVQWVTTAYMLAAAIMVPVTGFLYRSIPTKRLLISALALLLIGTVGGVAATSFPLLLVARIVQAVGTGMIVPIGMNLTLAVAPRGKLGTYMGVVSAMTTLGPAFGPIVAGAVLALGSWHLLFAVFAVLVALCLIGAVFAVRDVAELTHPRLDLASTGLVSLGLIGVLYGISTVFSGAPMLAVASLAVGIAALAAFLVRQTKIAEPLINVRPFKNRAFSTGLAIIVIALMTVFSMNMVLPLFMQGSLGLSAFEAALTLLPACVISCVLAPVAGKVYDRVGLRVMLPIGLALIAAFTFALSRCTEAATSPMLVCLYAPVIIGCALSMGPAQSFALSSLDRAHYPHGVTIVSTFFQIAGCVGSSLFVGVLAGVQQGSAAAGATLQAATASGFSAACLVATGLGVVGFCLAIALGRIEKKHRQAESPASASSAPAAPAAAIPVAPKPATPVPAGQSVES